MKQEMVAGIPGRWPGVNNPTSRFGRWFIFIFGAIMFFLFVLIVRWALRYADDISKNPEKTNPKKEKIYELPKPISLPENIERNNGR